MDFQKFRTLPPVSNQNPIEWRIFMGFLCNHFKSKGIANPVVLELGTEAGRQKAFYEKILHAQHIGVDYNLQAVADIYGDTLKEETLRSVKKLLGGKLVDVLFIDTTHKYANVTREYTLYRPLVRHIIAFHDIRFPEIKKFWEEIQEQHKGNSFFTIIGNIEGHEHYNKMGIGVEVLA